MTTILPLDRETMQKLRIQIAMGMKARALTRNGFAELLGINRCQVTRMFTAERWNPNMATLQRISNILGMDIIINVKPNGDK